MPSPRYSSNTAVSCTGSDFLSQETQMVRSYCVTAKGIKRQPSLHRVQRHPSNASVSSSNSSGCEFRESRRISSTATSTLLPSPSPISLGKQAVKNYSVMMLGAPAVGKSALISQFISEHSAVENDDLSENPIGDNIVSVVLDGKEVELNFLDKPETQSLEAFIKNYDADAYVVVYSITDRISFCRAEIILNFLQECAFIADKAVILVSNKTDLVRLRVVSVEEGKSMAETFGCKFIETSHWLNHNIDELLVGLCSQIHLKQQQKAKQQQNSDNIHRYKGSKTSLYRSKTIVKSLFQKLIFKSKSCDNFLVL